MLGIFTEELIIVGQFASCALLAATIAAGVVSGDRNKQNSEEFILLLNADELGVKIFLIFKLLLGDS